MTEIGLFPLNIVMFPESVYPLHIFEERYKLLINESIDEQTAFGINLLDDKKMYDVGCSCHISDVIKRYPDGKLDILAVGIKRYKLLNMIDGKKSYYIGEVDFFEDDETDFDYELLKNAVSLFNDIASAITTVKIDEIVLDKLTTMKPSFYIAQKSGLSPQQKQELLAISNENQRLTRLLEHLDKLLPIIKDAENITRILKYDGYFKPDFYKK